jgi:C1A family cysteine protease
MYVLALLLGVVYGQSWNEEFNTKAWKPLDHKQVFKDWAKHHGRNYGTNEEAAYRYGLWTRKMDEVIEVNDANLHYKFRMNQFGDLTHNEFLIAIHGHNESCLNFDESQPSFVGTVDSEDLLESDVPAPASVDWIKAGDVNAVKSQGSCGSCWAFATNGAMECDAAIKKGKLLNLSEQQLVDCTKKYGNNGCGGGWWFNSFKYITDVGGLCDTKSYPYTARDGTCKDKTCGTMYDAISQTVKVTANNEAQLTNAVAVGCNAVGVQASFGSYSSGVFTGNCGTSINHGVTITGYGVLNSLEYWNVRNSWGASWGDKGYIKICKNCNKNGAKGQCGINMYPAYVVNK